MPANYVFESIFCRNNNDYIIISNRSAFPEN